MTASRNALAAALLAVTSCPTSAGQPDPDSHARLVEALASEARLNADFEAGLAARSEAELRKDAEIVADEAECPGSIALMLDVMKPPVLRSYARAVQNYRAALRGLFQTRLGDREAAGAAQFFSSDLGQRLLAASAQVQVTTRQEAELAGGDGDAVVSEAALEADKEATKVRALSTMEPLLLREVDASLRQAPWYPAYAALQDDIVKLELILANADITAEDEAQIETRTTEVLTQHFDTCYSRK